MKLDEQTWTLIGNLLSKRDNVEVWTKKYLSLSLAQLNKIEGLSVSLELKEVTPSYLDFLREQIALKPRGEEWSHIMENRLNALLPFENQKRITFYISANEGRLTADLMPQLDRVIRVEYSK